MKNASKKIIAAAREHRVLTGAIAITLVLAITAGVLFGTGAFWGIGERLRQVFSGDDGTVDIVSQPDIGAVAGDFDGPDITVSGWLCAGTDYSTENIESGKASIDRLIKSAREYGLNSLIVPVYDGDRVIYPSHLRKSVEYDYLRYIVDAAHDNMLAVYVVYDVFGDTLDIFSEDSVNSLCAEIENICHSYSIDGMLFDDYYITDTSPYRTYYTEQGGGMGLDSFCRDKLSMLMRKLSQTIYSTDGGIFAGAVCDPVCYSSAVADDGMTPIDRETDAYAEGHADITKWVSEGYVKFLLVRNYRKMSDAVSFDTVCDWWTGKFGGAAHVAFSLAANKVAEWNKTDELSKQLSACTSQSGTGAAFYTLTDLADDRTGSTLALVKYIDMILIHENGSNSLIMTSPSSTEFTTYSDSVSFIGSSDPAGRLTCNGQTVECTKTGYFSFDKQLSVGKNTFTFEHNSEKKTYTVTYIQVIIKSINPSSNKVMNGDAQVTVTVSAMAGASLKAKLGTQTVRMTAGDYSGNDDAQSAMRFVQYTALFKMPTAKSEAQNLGYLTVTAEYGGKRETKRGGRFTVRGTSAGGTSAGGSSSSNTSSSTNTQFIPGIGSYNSGYGIKVGEGERYVCEVLGYQVTTLDGNLIDNRSRPTNAYLPAGTVDYCTTDDVVFFDPDSGKQLNFRTLDYGKRIICDSDVSIFKATLPVSNSITVASAADRGNQMVVTFDTQWKAPFNVTYGGQSYSKPYPSGTTRPDYTISSATFKYVDIEFCYTVSGQGKVVPTDNSVFSSSEWVKNKAGNYVLRLHLKKAGAFYGWTAQYNEQNQLEFYFLNPSKITESNNSYGYDLTGITVMLDAGHGGSDPGAVGSSQKYTEAVLNIILVNKIKRELENIGATVIMTRTTDKNVSLDERAKQCYAVKPDVFISVHRNSSTSSSAAGYEDYYFYPFSYGLANAIYGRASGNFGNRRGVKYYPFRVTRMSCCPSVLTENGYISNSKEMEKIKSDRHNEALAKSTVRGIVDYFVSIQQ